MAQRRIGTDTSETRSVLLDVTERLMIEEGYASVSSRRVATEAGVTGGLVHYYFPTLEDLFLAVLRRRGDQQFERQKRLLTSAQPLRELWAFISEQARTALFVEFMALANHRKPIQSELAGYFERFRQTQLDALSARLKESGLDPGEVPPVVVLVLMAAVSRTVVMEEALGLDTGLAETLAFVERHLERLEGPAPTKRRGRGRPQAKGSLDAAEDVSGTLA